MVFSFKGSGGNRGRTVSSTGNPMLVATNPKAKGACALIRQTVCLVRRYNIRPRGLFVTAFARGTTGRLVAQVAGRLTQHGVATGIGRVCINAFRSLYLHVLGRGLRCAELGGGCHLLSTFSRGCAMFRGVCRFHGVPGISTILPSDKT